MYAVSVLNVTPERWLQPPEPQLAERMPPNVLTLGDWDVTVAVSQKKRRFILDLGY